VAEGSLPAGELSERSSKTEPPAPALPEDKVNDVCAVSTPPVSDTSSAFITKLGIFFMAYCLSPSATTLICPVATVEPDESRYRGR
jgi:hypothetical protein